ncbi:MAG: lamin tail domain-containing protein [Thermoplasmata archaeon]|nr:lamin tail domain-containing protein [Thermoplasmata archaeon]
MVKSALIAAALLLAALVGLPAGTSAEEEGRLIINEVMYDPPGSEVDGEWIEVLVVEGETDTGGWTLSDLDGHVFTLPPLTLPVQTYVLMRIGGGISELDASDGRITLYMNFSQPVLNNNGDELLLDGGGTAFDFFAYGSGSLVDYPPKGVQWDGRNLTSRAGQSLSLFPNGMPSDGPEDWFSLPPTPGSSNGLYQTGEDDVLLAEVYYNNLRDDEYVCILNRGTWDVNLTGWIITDHEADVSFPESTIIRSRQGLCLTHNSTSYYEDVLAEADFTYRKGDVDCMSVYGGQFALRNDGDEVVILTQYGREVDSFVWGDSETMVLGWEGEPADITRKGASARRLSKNGTLTDTNSSSDWQSLKDFGIGQSSFGRESFTVSGPVISFYSPGISLEILRELLRNATHSILLNAYQLTSKAIGDELAKAALRGTEVRILLEGQPVSGMTSRGLALIEDLASLGVDVRLLVESPEDATFKRYAYNHAKYAVIDNRSLLLSSENWGNNGYPDDGEGNRGWGVVVEDEELAAYFTHVFLEDWNPLRRDSMAFDDALERLHVHEDEDASQGREEPFLTELRLTEAVEVTALIGPDNAMDDDTILGMIDAAEDRILVEQFYIRKTWRVRGNEFLNPFLDRLIKAAERGCEVKVLLDPTWYNVLPSDPNDNDDTVEFLNSLAVGQNLNMTAKLMDLDAHGIVKLHNKGMVVDGDRVLISSLNWNYNSFARNREAGLILTNERIAAYFERIFMHDWKDDVAPPVAIIDGAATARVGESVMLSALSSYDDSGIVRFSWDTDSDGLEDSSDPVIHVSFPRAGTFTISLEVEDSWGNTDATSIELVVEEDDGPPGLELAVVAIAIPAVSLPAFLYHFRKRRTKDI